MSESSEAVVIKCLKPGAIVPTKGGVSNGYRMHTTDACILYPGERVVLRTGVSMTLPPSVCGRLNPYHRLVVDHGVFIVPCPIENDVEIRMVAFNLGSVAVHIRSGDCMALVTLETQHVTPPVHVRWLDE